MDEFVLTIPTPRRTGAHIEPYGSLVLINSALRRKAGITDEEPLDDFIGLTTDYTTGVKRLQIFQDHGIRDKNVSSDIKESFKRDMPKILKMFPNMASPFTGHIEFHTTGFGLRKVHFLPKK